MQSYLVDLNVSIDEDIEDQDYYTLRSSMFAKFTHSVASLKFKEDYGKVIRKFIKEVSPYYIYKNYVFKRTAYDAGLFYDIFLIKEMLYTRICLKMIRVHTHCNNGHYIKLK